MYFADVDPAAGELVALELVPLQVRRFQLVHAVRADQDWLLRRLNEVGQRYGTRLEVGPDGRFLLRR
jgi:poly-gamma-glutamate synthesis protein (capsule biosynthesis protein)